MKLLPGVFFRKKRKLKKQQALFAEALSEVGYVTDPDDIKISHDIPKCYYRSEEFELLFPLRYLRACRNLSYDKVYDFCFRGLHTSKREWVNNFQSANSKIAFTDTGRKIDKNHFDVGYYQEMANARYTLCPPGDFKWTYRFLEAIMCHSIPVIERGAEHPHVDGFIYRYADSSPDMLLKEWDKNAIIANYRLFLQRHTLLDRIIFFNTPWP